METLAGETEVTPPETPLPSPIRARPPGRGKWWVRRGGELVTVFVGVYAAFLLNGYQLHRQEMARRAQLLKWLAGFYGEQLVEVKKESAEVQRQSDEFDRQLAAGEMPDLHDFDLISDYDPADTASILQSGGYDLLDIDTVRAIKESDGTLRGMMMVLHHDQQISDALILPNLGRGKDVFYDPATKQLREGYKWYGRFFHTVVRCYAELVKHETEAVECLHREEERNR